MGKDWYYNDSKGPLYDEILNTQNPIKPAEFMG
jgi:hypothetical protein